MHTTADPSEGRLSQRGPGGRVDPTALVERGAKVDPSASVWQHSKIRSGAIIGARTRVGGWVYVGAGVQVGPDCKVENAAHLFEGSELARGVFIGPGAMLTNDKHPRAVRPDGGLKQAEDWVLAGVRVDEGASIGAGSIVLSGVHVGPWALVGAGATVVRDVPPYALVMGTPALQAGWVCRCGTRVDPDAECERCDRRYRLAPDGATFFEGPR